MFYKYILILLLVVIIFTSNASVAIAQDSLHYWICSYVKPFEFTNLIIIKIDLNSNSITDSTIIPFRGELAFSTPLNLIHDNMHYLAVFAVDGLIGKNSNSEDMVFTNYAILNEEGKLLHIGRLPHIDFAELAYPQNNFNPQIRYLLDISDSTIDLTGQLRLDSRLSPRLSNVYRNIFDNHHYPIIDGFQYFKRISQVDTSLYWNLHDKGVYVLRIDLANRKVMDSINVFSSDNHSYVFGLRPDSTLYAFVINSNFLSLDTLFRPSFVKLIDSQNFALLDSIPITMPQLSYGCISNEYGVADRLGPFFVYYYFVGEGYANFAPAMLFIFDTRTNEATWLRVGWR